MSEPIDNPEKRRGCLAEVWYSLFQLSQLQNTPGTPEYIERQREIRDYHRHSMEKDRQRAFEAILWQAVIDDPTKTVEEHEAILLGQQAAPSEEVLEEIPEPDPSGIQIGTVAESLTVVPEIAGAEMDFDVTAPWFRPYLEMKLNEKLPYNQETIGNPVSINRELRNAHIMVAGGSRSGKSCVSLHILRAHLKAGYSAVLMDVKEDTIKQALVVAEEAAIPKEAISVLWPEDPTYGVPAYNLFKPQDGKIAEAVQEFTELIHKCSGSWGVVIDDLFKNACAVVAAQGLSIYELGRFFIQPAYRKALVQRARNTAAWELFPVQHEALAYEFLSKKESDQARDCSAVFNKWREVIRSDYMLNMFSGTGDDLDLGGLWQKQRIILVHLHERKLGADGLKLFAGLLTQKLYNHAMSREGGNRVVVFLDEIGSTETASGTIISDIVSKAASQNMQLICACQFMDQMSPKLRESLLTSTDVKISLKLSQGDAIHVARGLSFGTGKHVNKVVVSPGGGPGEKMTFRIMKSPTAAFNGEAASHAAVMSLNNEHGRYIDHVKPRLYLQNLRTWEIYPLTDFLIDSLPETGVRLLETSGSSSRWIVEVDLPPMSVRVAERTGEGEYGSLLTKKLMNLGKQRAIVKIGDRIEGIRTSDIHFPNPLPGVGPYLRGQTWEEITRIRERRSATIADLVHGPGFTPTPTRKIVRVQTTPVLPPARKPATDGEFDEALKSLEAASMSADQELDQALEALSAERQPSPTRRQETSTDKTNLEYFVGDDNSF